ncbi:hypothetical protein ABEY82_28390 [Priestia megaterium]
MEFNKQFALNIQKVFEKNIRNKRAHDETKQLLDDFFHELEIHMEEVLKAVPNDEFSLDIREQSYSIHLYSSYLKIDYSMEKIRVTAAPNGDGYIHKFFYNPDEYSYLYQGESFNEKILHRYISKTFQKPLEQLIGEEIAMSIEE